MKVTTTQYAKTLYELTENKSEKEISGTVASFIKILVRDKKLKVIKQIINRFSEIYNKENNIIEAEITTSRQIESPQLQKIKNFLKEKYQAEEVVLGLKTDKTIKGGMIIRIGDEILDASIENQISNLKKALTA